MSRTARPSIASYIWFAGMVGGFIALAVTEAVSPSTLDDLWAWVRALALGWELLAWFLTLPWLLALAVWQSGWETWARIATVVAVALAWSLVSIPRRAKGSPTPHREQRPGHPRDAVLTRHGLRHIRG